MTPRIIAITGGIGAGKSVVSRIVSALGYPVYDCDSRAKQLMDSSDGIKRQIAEKISAEAISGNAIRRDILAAEVFGNPEKLNTLNAIVHHHVREDIRREAQHCSSPLLFVETAILYESRLDQMVDTVWEVTAPEQIRIDRVISRNHCTHEQALARIDSQRTVITNPHHSVRTIINDNLTPILPRVLQLLHNL